MERQDNDDHNRAQVAQGNAGSGHLRANLVPVGLTAGASPCSTNPQSTPRFGPTAGSPLNCYLIIPPQGTRSCGLRHNSVELGRPILWSPAPQNGCPAFVKRPYYGASESSLIGWIGGSEGFPAVTAKLATLVLSAFVALAAFMPAGPRGGAVRGRPLGKAGRQRQAGGVVPVRRAPGRHLRGRHRQGISPARGSAQPVLHAAAPTTGRTSRCSACPSSAT